MSAQTLQILAVAEALAAAIPEPVRVAVTGTDYFRGLDRRPMDRDEALAYWRAQTTDADRARQSAADAKRARKAAKRLREAGCG